MTIATGTYTSNGLHQSIALGFRPEFVLIKPGTLADYLIAKVPGFWSGRTNVLGGSDSFISGIALTETGFTVGLSAKVNTNGETFHYIALARSSDFKMAAAGWQGNGAARTILLDDTSLTPSAVIVKRDSTRDAAILVTGSTCARMGGVVNAEAGAISSFAAGSFDVNTSVYTNEYDALAELGEGIDAVAWEAGTNIAVATWVGNGSAGRTIALPFTPKAVIIQKVDGTVRSGRIKTDTMTAGLTAPVNAGALQANEVSIVTNGIQIGSVVNMNETSANYCAIAFKDHATAATAAPAVIKRGRKGVLLRARGATSWIDCGTDASLVIDGALTLEWMGSLEPLSRSAHAAMMWRGSATTDTALSCSLAMFAGTWVGGSGANFFWSAPTISIGCSDRLDLSAQSSDIRKAWRTGQLTEYGRMNHWMTTHNGSGRWRLFKNGRVIRQRDLDLTSVPLPNIDGQKGHRMVLGATYNSGAPTNMQRQTLMLARIYNRELTVSEVADRFARAGLLSSVTDVTSGLVEEWDAANASGASLPATTASANNGTITGGSVVNL